MLRAGDVQAETAAWDSTAKEYVYEAKNNFDDDPFLRLMLEKSGLNSEMRSLDIGCGAGAYSIALARKVAKADGVDLSPRMVELGTAYAAEHGVKNLRLWVRNWHTCDGGEFRGKYNLVFAHTTPAVADYTTLVKMCEASRGCCFLCKPARRTDEVFDGLKRAVAMEDLARKTGLPIIGVYGDAFNSHYLTDSIALIGDVLGTQEHASAVADAINGWVSDLDRRTKDIPNADKPTVYPGAVSWSGGHGFTGTYVGYAPLEAIHAVNLADELDASDGVEVSMEQILEWDPDIIFLNPGNMGLVNEDYAANGAAIDSLSAVKAGKVYAQVNFNYYWCNMELAIVDSYYAGSIIVLPIGAITSVLGAPLFLWIIFKGRWSR